MVYPLPSCPSPSRSYPSSFPCRKDSVSRFPLSNLRRTRSLIPLPSFANFHSLLRFVEFPTARHSCRTEFPPSAYHFRSSQPHSPQDSSPTAKSFDPHPVWTAYFLKQQASRRETLYSERRFANSTLHPTASDP